MYQSKKHSTNVSREATGMGGSYNTCASRAPVDRLEAGGRIPYARPMTNVPADPHPARTDWEHQRFCPNCNERLVARQCKARCLRCGFFLDCGDVV